LVLCSVCSGAVFWDIEHTADKWAGQV
jgi:hypothetical protein